MRRRLWVLLPFVLVLPACSSDDSPAIDGAGQKTTTTAGGSSTTSSTAATSSTSTTAASVSDGRPLTGPAGTSGTLRYTVAADRSELCYRIVIRNAGAATAAHLHRESGETVLELTPPGADGTVDTCSATDAITLQELQERPAQFFIEVHAAKGVLRGTLG